MLKDALRLTSVPQKNPLSAAHARFARAVLLIYFGAAAVAVGLLIAALITDKAHEETQTSERLLLETDVRAHSLAQHLDLLVEELRRLSLRAEVDPFDQDLTPEKSLLQLSHENSTFFNLGVAILGPKGNVLWTEPEKFLKDGTSFVNERWFSTAQRSRKLHIVPIKPDRPDSVLYVVSPVVRNGEFAGALLGGVDLVDVELLAEGDSTAMNGHDHHDPPHTAPSAITILTTDDGSVVYPPKPPPFSLDPAWSSLFHTSSFEPFVETTTLEGSTMIVAASPVAGTDLVLLSVADRDTLFRSARNRLLTRLLLGLFLVTTPLLSFIIVLQRSLMVFQKSEAAAVREERLRTLGEASNSIAHEVKNALNGLSMGLDLIVRRDDTPESAARRERVLGELRKEIQRLSDFTTELMTFSKGIEPRRTKIDLSAFVPKVTALARDSAAELGAELEVSVPASKIMVDADPTLLHAVISNLTGNALDAVTGKGSPASPKIEVRLEARGRQAELRFLDNGPGVSPSMKPRLFEPFQTDKPNGVGIGLALARKIARAHRGDLVLEEGPPPHGDEIPSIAEPSPRSKPEGATFLLTLPLEDA